METSGGKLIILDTVDSTNNYAMARLHQGLAEHGDAWFAREQTSGKGRLGKEWKAEANQNVMMSVVIKPSLGLEHQFQLSAAVAVAMHKLLTKFIDEIKIKWPNDLYWRDRKAGGILIENIVQGNKWQWAVAGIGINVNQIVFDDSLPNPVSLKQTSQIDYDVIDIAAQLRLAVMDECRRLLENGFDEIYEYYNASLYKAGETVWLKKDNARFQTTIRKVLPDGRLLVDDTMERSFGFGEVEWVVAG